MQYGGKKKKQPSIGDFVSGTSSYVTLISVFIGVCRGILDWLAFMSYPIVIIDAEQGTYFSPFSSKVGNYTNVIKCFYTIEECLAWREKVGVHLQRAQKGDT